MTPVQNRFVLTHSRDFTMIPPLPCRFRRHFVSVSWRPNRHFGQLEEKLPISKCYRCIKNCNPTQIPYCITKALIDAVQGDVENGLVFCGADVGAIHEITTVKAVIDELLECMFMPMAAGI